MGHDTAVIGLCVPLEVDFTFFVVINNTLVPLFLVVLATIVRRMRYDREFVAILICRAVAGKGQFVSFGVIVVKGVRILEA